MLSDVTVPGGSFTTRSVAAGKYTLTEDSPGTGWTNMGGFLWHGDGDCPTAPTQALQGSLDLDVDPSNGEFVSTTYVCWYNLEVGTPPCLQDCAPPPVCTSDCDPPPPPPTPTPPPAQVLASSAQISKVLSTADPARVGERVTFTVTLTISGDSPVTGAALVDTYENTYLRFVGASPGPCAVASGTPDPLHDRLTCPLGDVTPGTLGNPGSVSFVYLMTYEALAPTPTETLNRVVATVDLDGSGPAVPATMGPADAIVHIITLPLALPKAGAEFIERFMPPWQVLAALVVAAPLLGAVIDRRREPGLHSR